MRERMAILDWQQRQLETERRFVVSGIQEINRRLAVVDEVEEWNLLTEPDDAANYAVTDQMEFGSEESIEWVRVRAEPAILPA